MLARQSAIGRERSRRLDASRGDIESPREDERNRETNEQRHDHKTQRPIREFPCGKYRHPPRSRKPARPQIEAHVNATVDTQSIL